MDFKVEPSVNGSNVAHEQRENVFQALQTINTPNHLSFRSGSGAPLGPPPSPPQLSSAGSGNLVGTYSYAYLEGDTTGQTTLSPAASITVAGEQVKVEVPLGRPGTTGRRLYRTTSGGSEFFLLLDFASGDGYFQQVFVDNVPDSSLGAAAPSADTTGHYDFQVFKSVKYFRTHPDVSEPHDVTLINGDPRSTTGWCIDSYGSIVARQKLSDNFISFHTGDKANHFSCNWNEDTYPGGMNMVFDVEARGRVNVRPFVKGIALWIAPRNPTTVQGEACLRIDPEAGSTQPTAWFTAKGTAGGSDTLFLEQQDPAGTASCLKLKQAGTGPLISAGSAKFRVSAQSDVTAGSLEIRTSNNTLVQRIAPSGSTSWHDANGTLKAQLDNSNGYLRGPGFTSLANTGAYIDTGGDRIQILQRNPAAATLRLAGAASQSGNILETSTNTGAVGMAIDANRRLKWFSGAEQSSVGANGSAARPPNNPAKYLAVTDSTGKTLLIPAYNP
jgi:hypothetical protein